MKMAKVPSKYTTKLFVLLCDKYDINSQGDICNRRTRRVISNKKRCFLTVGESICHEYGAADYSKQEAVFYGHSHVKSVLQGIHPITGHWLDF